jgi:hypothetical protein
VTVCLIRSLLTREKYDQVPIHLIFSIEMPVFSHGSPIFSCMEVCMGQIFRGMHPMNSRALHGTAHGQARFGSMSLQVELKHSCLARISGRGNPSAVRYGRAVCHMQSAIMFFLLSMSSASGRQRRSRRAALWRPLSRLPLLSAFTGRNTTQWQICNIGRRSVFHMLLFKPDFGGGGIRWKYPYRGIKI